MTAPALAPSGCIACCPSGHPARVTILATAGETPHAIPVSAAIRAGPRHALIGLAGSRGSLARLRADPRVALTIIAAGRRGDRARARAGVDEALVEGVVAVEIEVDDVQDHDRPTFAIEAGVRWRWTDAEAERVTPRSTRRWRGWRSVGRRAI